MRSARVGAFCAAAIAVVLSMSCSGERVVVAGADNGATESLTSVAAVSVSIDREILPIGQTTQAVAELRATDGTVINKPVTWTSSSPEVAVVTSNGSIIAVGVGTVAITASSEGESGNAMFTVLPVAVASVTVAMDPATILVGKTTQATATMRAASGALLLGRSVTWSSADTTIAKISEAGVVTGVAPGSVVITGTSEGKFGSALVGVASPNAPPPGPSGSVTSVSVSLVASALNPGQTTQASAAVKDGLGNTLSGKTIAWSSANPAVATVSSTGLVSAVAVGSVVISAQSEGKVGGVTLVVQSAQPAPTPAPAQPSTPASDPATALVAAVIVTLSSPSFMAGTETEVTAVAVDSRGVKLTGRIITWETSNPKISSIIGGKLHGWAEGAATVIAKCGDKKGQAGHVVRKQIAHFYFHAHEDDWQLFMGDAAYNSIGDAGRVVFVYATAGDANLGTTFWQARERGAKASMDSLQHGGAAAWPCATVIINGHNIWRCQKGLIVSLFLRLPDGGLNGEGFGGRGSMSWLRDGVIQSLSAIDNSTTYTSWADLTSTFAAIVDRETDVTHPPHQIHAPETDRTINPGDHPDHLAVGDAVKAVIRPGTWRVTWHVDYHIKDLPVNLTQALHDIKQKLFYAHDDIMGAAGYGYNKFEPEYIAWLWRSYSRAN